MLELTLPGLANANDCFHINMVYPFPRNRSPKTVFSSSFSPAFTYAIFGEDETIFGYKGLEVKLHFRANDALPLLASSYDKKYQAADGEQALDISRHLEGVIPSSMTLGSRPYAIPCLTVADAMRDHDEPASDHLPDATAPIWVPPGENISSFECSNRQFEVWRATLADARAVKLFGHIQILVPLFIDGGTMQDLNDHESVMERWSLYLLYDKTTVPGMESLCPYKLVGFATSFRFFTDPTQRLLAATGLSVDHRLMLDPNTMAVLNPTNPLDHPSRERISQFVILPPYQGLSYGSRFYTALYAHIHKQPSVYEITVEEPSQAFDDMRELCDLMTLSEIESFAALRLPSNLPKELLDDSADASSASNTSMSRILGDKGHLEEIRIAAKLAPRQFQIVLELHLLSSIPSMHRSMARALRGARAQNEEDRKFFFWLLGLKDRLKLHNHDVLKQLPAEQRPELIHDTALGIVKEYERLLSKLAKRTDEADGAPARKRRKMAHKVLHEDDTDEDTARASAPNSASRAA